MNTKKPSEAVLRNAIEEYLQRLGLVYRDCAATGDYFHQYRVGTCLFEPRYVDATCNRSGFLTPIRFLIATAEAADFRGVNEKTRKWGMTVIPRGGYFKVLSVIAEQGTTQILLLHYPQSSDILSLVEFRKDIEEFIIEEANNDFRACLKLPKLVDLDNKEWLDRLVFPIGIDQDTGMPIGDEDHMDRPINSKQTIN